MKCPKCNAENPQGENFCMQCGASLRRPQSMVTQTDPPASINPSHVVATSVGSSNKIFFILLAVIVLVGIIIVVTIMLSGPSTPNLLSIDQAVEEGYPVHCVSRGEVDGLPRNYDIYIECPRFSTAESDTGELFYLYDGVNTYAYTSYEDDPSWVLETESFFKTTCLEFLNNYRDLDGVTVDCQIVQEIPDSKFQLPVAVSDSPLKKEIICDELMPVGERYYDEEGDLWIINTGLEIYNGKEMCRVDLEGGLADDCGGITGYVDFGGIFSDAETGVFGEEEDYMACVMGVQSQECYDICMYYAFIF